MDKIFSKLFPKDKDQGKKSNPTEGHPRIINEQTKPLGLKINPPQMIVGSAQSVGKVRTHNEDSLFTLSSVFSDGEIQLPFGIYIIADGMGGHQYGEVASRCAVKTVADYLMAKLFSQIMGLQNESTGESLIEILENAVERAQENVVQHAPGGGTTLSIAVIIGSQVTIAHVGDSRVYIRQADGTLSSVTQDHSFVSRLIEQGHISKEEAEIHPQRNVLYRAIGQHEPFQPDIQTFPFPENGELLICSDGLWGVAGEDNIKQILNQARDVTTTCHLLTEAANIAGGSDNISVILVKMLG